MRSSAAAMSLSRTGSKVMNQTRDDGLTGSRLLIGLGSTALASGVLDVAIELASALQAEVSALFVEEQQLYDLIELPIASLVVSSGQTGQRLSREAVSESLKAQAKTIRRDLSMLAESRNLRWSFESRHGDTLATIMASARASDILLLGGTAATITPRRRVELAIRLSETVTACLVVPDILRNRRGAIVVVDPLRDRETTFAQRIASALGERFVALRGEIANASSFHQLETTLSNLRPRLIIVRDARHVFSDPIAAAGLMRAGGAPLLLFNS
jgi:hypothetical protein